MTQREVARALGCSRTLVQAIERRALIKLAIGLGEPPRPYPHWAKRVTSDRTAHRCRSCGLPGHNKNGCIARAVKPGRTSKVWD